MKSRTTFALGAICGAALWAASPALTSYLEPWDAPGFYYLGGLLAITIVTGAFGTGRFLLGPLAVCLGQAVWVLGMMLFRGEASLWPLTLAALVMTAVPTVIGSAIGFALRGIWKKISGG